MGERMRGRTRLVVGVFLIFLQPSLQSPLSMIPTIRSSGVRLGSYLMKMADEAQEGIPKATSMRGWRSFR